MCLEGHCEVIMSHGPLQDDNHTGQVLAKATFNHSPAGSSHPTNSALEDNTSYADESISQLNEVLTIFRETSWEP